MTSANICGVSEPEIPKLKFITSAPLSAAYFIAPINAYPEPLPPSSIFTDIILEYQETPAIPFSLFVAAAIMPAQ